MTESVRAVRASVQIGSVTVNGFMLPDGSYQMSQTQVAKAVGLSQRNLSIFLRSNALKSLLGEDYTPQTFEIEPALIATQTRSLGLTRYPWQSSGRIGSGKLIEETNKPWLS